MPPELDYYLITLTDNGHHLTILRDFYVSIPGRAAFETGTAPAISVSIESILRGARDEGYQHSDESSRCILCSMYESDMYYIWISKNSRRVKLLRTTQRIVTFEGIKYDRSANMQGRR
jgi:hypothetical protein